MMLTLPWPSAGQPKIGDFQPTVLAVFDGDSKLNVSVAVNPPKDVSGTRGTLQVQLFNDKNLALAGRTNQVGGKYPDGGNHSMPLSVERSRTAGTRLRVTYRDAAYEVPLEKVLVLKGHETTLSTGQEFYVGSQAPFSCTVHAIRSLTENVPIAAAEVMVRIESPPGRFQMLGHSHTNANGRCDLQMKMPQNLAAGDYNVEVITRSPLGRETFQRKIKLKSDAKILLTSDKPIYQPGHMMHVRALVLRPVDMKPVANKEMQFEIEDAKGNKVFKKTLTTSEFGIASVDFQLADEVNMGDYHVRAAVGEHRADKTVTVKRYVLPKFKVVAKADKTFYLPKEKIQVELQSDYFFGKPVSKAKVEVTASTFDVQFKEFHKWMGTTDDNGHAKFDVQLPDYFVGQPLHKGNALVKLEMKVLDTADHKEIDHARPSRSAISRSRSA